jgi:hypothetical protein
MAGHGCLPAVDVAQRNEDPHLHSNHPPNWNERAGMCDFLQEHELAKVRVQREDQPESSQHEEVRMI